jgi:hypothetical protein
MYSSELVAKSTLLTSGGVQSDGAAVAVIEDTEVLAEMGRRSKRLVGERYLWNDVADAYERVLEGLC